MAKYNPKKLNDYIEIISKNMGLIAPVAKALGVNRNTIYNWLEKYPEFKQAFNDANENVLDFTEGKLYELVKDKNLGAICFLLKCKGKERGYVEKEFVKIDINKEDIRIDMDAMNKVTSGT
jgi:transposase